ncbi:MAG: hypothetical protein HC904_05045 [Blastochloris sp.]|nr:hypothetical protein [Blastochloris sp.]
MVSGFKADKADGIDAVIQFDLSGDGGGQFYLQIANGSVAAHEGSTVVVVLNSLRLLFLRPKPDL